MTHAGGRPAKELTPRDLAQIEALAGYGLTLAAIAAAIGLHPSTLRRKRVQANVAAALARGKAKAEGIIGEALFKRAKGGDVQAIRWWEMTRSGRSDKQTHEHSGPDGAAIPHSVTVRFVRPGA